MTGKITPCHAPFQSEHDQWLLCLQWPTGLHRSHEDSQLEVRDAARGGSGQCAARAQIAVFLRRPWAAAAFEKCSIYGRSIGTNVQDDPFRVFRCRPIFKKEFSKPALTEEFFMEAHRLSSEAVGRCTKCAPVSPPDPSFFSRSNDDCLLGQSPLAEVRVRSL